MADRTTRIGAVVLAGGQVPPSLAHRCDYRALLKVRGRYLLAFLFDTLRAAPSIVATATRGGSCVLTGFSGACPDNDAGRSPRFCAAICASFKQRGITCSLIALRCVLR